MPALLDFLLSITIELKWLADFLTSRRKFAIKPKGADAGDTSVYLNVFMWICAYVPIGMGCQIAKEKYLQNEECQHTVLLPSLIYLSSFLLPQIQEKSFLKGTNR